jgi:lipopolysaccharide biosynthesis protein
LADTGTEAGALLRWIAFYLPQYHPVPENDRWWGEGFTDWRKVAEARPRHRRQLQPQLPADLGFYDPRLAATRDAQADLARQYGIHGFCYYHYWFHGRRLLQEVVDQVLASGQPDFPFCLCWANENWTRTWDGGDREVLVEQTYSEADDLNHIRWLIQVFRDPRYIRVGGRPLLLVYRAGRLPAASRTAALWRSECARAGMDEPYLCQVDALMAGRDDPARNGFDAAVEFQPDWARTGPLQLSRSRQFLRRLGIARDHDDRVFEYAGLVEAAIAAEQPPYKKFRCVAPGWDNTARRQRSAHIFLGSTPDLYREWVSQTQRTFRPYSENENLAFVNAWNEWAEGAHLEPCQTWGRAYLEAHSSGTGHHRWN